MGKLINFAVKRALVNLINDKLNEDCSTKHVVSLLKRPLLILLTSSIISTMFHGAGDYIKTIKICSSGSGQFT